MREKVLGIVTSAISELNEELGYDNLETLSEETVIFGGDEGIDSLSLVRLVVSLEAEVAKGFDKKIILADEKVMSERNTPFKTVGTIVDFIVNLLQ